MEHISNSHLIYCAKREDVKTKNILKSQEKYYVVDSSFYNMLNWEDDWDMGSLLENIVYIELLRRGYQLTIAKVNDLEADFKCRKNDKIIYIQVSESILEKYTKMRELEPLKRIDDNYPKYLITADNMKQNLGSFIHLNIIDFLLSDDEEF